MMDQPSTCPSMDRVVARHGELRRAEEYGRQKAQELADWSAEQNARMNENLEAVRDLKARAAAADQPAERSFAEIFNDPMPRVRIKGVGHG